MAKKTSSPRANDAALKRSIARRFNDALAGRSPKAKQVDQRKERRLQRYRNELKASSRPGSVALSALEIAKRVDALLKNGERLTEIKKLAKPREFEYDEEGMTALLAEMHAVYNFCADAYRFAGVRNETLLAAGVIKQLPKKRSARSKQPE